MRRAAAPVLLLAFLTASVASARAASPSATPTGNLLVLLSQNDAVAASGRFAVDHLMAGTGARPAGISVPQIGLITVRPPRGMSAPAFAQLLRRLPGVSSVEPERRYVPRTVPNDPALSTNDPSAGVAYQWYLAREGFFSAWNISKGNGAVVGVIDTGIDATHPDLESKLAVAPVDQQAPSNSTGPADTDQVGHGTHVASLACADTNNGIGMAGAGYNCKLVIEKTDFTDSSIAASIVNATDHHVDALNMSFGPAEPDSGPAPRSEVRALNYAARHKVVLVAAAADAPTTDQGDPADVLQPPGTGAKLSKGIGLDVTAANYSDAKASFAGYGSEISLAAYGEFQNPAPNTPPCTGPPLGIFGAYPGNPTQLEAPPDYGACRVVFEGDPRYARIAGTSMAAPQVAATAAMMRALNPYATLSDVLRAIKRTAQRGSKKRWNGDLGWGILNAGAALNAIRRVDRLPPLSHVIVPRVTHKLRFLVKWVGHDQRRPGLIASGIAYYKLYVRINGGPRQLLLSHTHRHSLLFKGQPGNRYQFFTVAVDRAGNRQVRLVRRTTRVI